MLYKKTRITRHLQLILYIEHIILLDLFINIFYPKKLHIPIYTNIKLTEAINQVENLTKGKVVRDKQVLTLMRYYELVKELENVHEDK